MDPIAAYRKQQERNGVKTTGTTGEKTLEELRKSNPRWATIFDRMDTSKDGLLQLEEVTRGFKQVLGAGSEVPLHQISKIYQDIMDAENAETDKDGLDFKQFVQFSQNVSTYMMDCPKWAAAEAAKDAEVEKTKLAAAKAKKDKEGPDIYALLGLKKGKDMQEVEARKKKALATAHTRRSSMDAGLGSGRISLAALTGNSIVRSSSQVGLQVKSSPSGSRPGSAGAQGELPSDGVARRRSSADSAFNPMMMRAAQKFSNLKRAQMSIESVNSAASAQDEDEPEPVSPTKKLRDMWERFSLSSARGRTPKTLSNSRQIQLPDSLPQVRALGKRNAGCNSLRFSPDGSQLAGGFFDGGVRVFDVDKGSETFCMNLPKFKGGSVKSAEEREREKERLAAMGEDEGSPSTVAFDRQLSDKSQAMDVDQDVDDHLRQRVMKKWEPVTNIRWQPGRGKMGVIASVDTQGALSLWDAPRGKDHRPPSCIGSVETGSAMTSVMFNCDGSSVACGGAERVIKLYDCEVDMGKGSLAPTQEFGKKVDFGGNITGHALKIVSLCADPTNPKVFASAGLDRHVLIWDMRCGGDPQHHIYGPELAGDAMDISRDGYSLLTGSHRSKNPIEIYDLRKSADAEPTVSYSWRGNEEASEGGGRWTTCLLFGAQWDEWENKTIVACGENENLARVFDRSADEGDPLRIVGTMRGKGQPFWSSAISGDGRTAAFGAADGAVCMVDITRK